MPIRLFLLAALLLASPRPGAAEEAERARNSPCTGVYTGSARGVFWCRVMAVHDANSGRTTVRVETEGDIQLSGDALAIVPGTFQWTGAPAVGLHKAADAAEVSAWSTLQTGQPPDQVDYGASHGAPKVAPDVGEMTLDLVRVEPGANVAGGQAFTVHGTFSAHLLPLPGSKGIGDVLISITF